MIMESEKNEITYLGLLRAIERNINVTHKEKGGIYNVVKIVKSKDRTSGSWYESVLYKNTDDCYFVRELNDFCKQFKICTIYESEFLWYLTH